jgi:hypothetical protein
MKVGSLPIQMICARFFAGLCAALLLSSCAKPLPTNKKIYEGEWRSKHVLLVITAGGEVSYTFQKGSMSKSINAPIKEFIGDDFVVGIGPLSTTFDVSRAPYQEDGEWKMIVDGHELIRADDNNSSRDADAEPSEQGSSSSIRV